MGMPYQPRAATIGLLAGASAGLIVGIGARIAMRAVSLAGDRTPIFSVPGTLTIVVTAVFYGMVGGLIFVATRKHLPGSDLGQGLLFGLLVLLVWGPVYFVSDQEGELHIAPLLGVILFSALFVVGAVIIAAVVQRLESALPALEGSTALAGYRLGGIVAMLVALGAAPTIIARVVLAIRHVATFMAGS